MIEETRLKQVAEILRRAGLNDQTLSLLRETFTDLHFTSCLDDDVGVGEPVHRDEDFNIYLVDGRSHCLKLTNDLDGATGLLLAQVEDED
ncbi:hypothetical protein ThidrDRAFT_2900 [Thiorhodococcus drewsii AZ1]|uniref:DUF6129 domain-containing protein n=1 Tax=Thiorhodococcus drewsii AZ1 TaxID=765913 RepID=G2E3N7_9GAMM|nr:DUF6129 family protein [Thiorhodococcus drewsii]EGV30150.1 hypothetical protein ThidrDRAFT_2900 [Thiorhodococcus drewsii AZ1]